MLDARASKAWKEAGEVWEAVSPRIVSARLKIVRRGQRSPGGRRESRNSFITVVSVYSPTARAPSGVKARFVNDLHQQSPSYRCLAVAW